MPKSLEYIRDDARRRVRITFRRLPELPEAIALIDRQIEESAWAYGTLYDFRAVSQPQPQAELEAIGAHIFCQLIARGPRGPVAFVTRSPGVVGPLQMYSYVVARAGVNAQVFWAIEDTEDWLDEQLSRIELDNA